MPWKNKKINKIITFLHAKKGLFQKYHPLSNTGWYFVHDTSETAPSFFTYLTMCIGLPIATSAASIVISPSVGWA